MANASIRWLRVASAAAFAAVLLAIGACGAIQIRSGRMVEPALLESTLKVGVSTAADVRRVLGEPEGKGRDALPTGLPPRSIWTYAYDESVIDIGGSGTDDRRLYLIVFMRDDRYDGYMWFSSLLDHRRPR